MIIMRTLERLIYLGWTADKLRERMAGCRAGIREHGEGSYRQLFIFLYVGYKRDLRTLTTPTTKE